MSELKPCHCGDRLATHVLTPEGTFCLDCMRGRKNRRAPRFTPEERAALEVAADFIVTADRRILTEVRAACSRRIWEMLDAEEPRGMILLEGEK
jgi:hypothetical protein